MSRFFLMGAAPLLALALCTPALAQSNLTTSGTGQNPAPPESASPAPAQSPPPSQTPQNSERFTGINATHCPPAGTVASGSAGTGPGPHCPPYEGSSSRGGTGTPTDGRTRPANTER